MTNEKMLERVNEIALHLDQEEADLYHDIVANGLRNIPGLAGLLADLAQDLRNDVARDAAKASGRGSALSAAKRIIKSAEAYTRDALKGAWVDRGKQCLCDGFHGVILDSEIPGLPQVSEDLEKLDLFQIISYSRANDGAALTLPDVGALKACIKVHSAEEKARKVKARLRTPATWDFGEGLPLVNAEFLLDMLELLPGCTAVCTRSRPEISGIYFQAEGQGEGILLPVRRPKKED